MYIGVHVEVEGDRNLGSECKTIAIKAGELPLFCALYNLYLT